jgi:hypothetical protein
MKRKKGHKERKKEKSGVVIRKEEKTRRKRVGCTSARQGCGVEKRTGANCSNGHELAAGTGKVDCRREMQLPGYPLARNKNREHFFLSSLLVLLPSSPLFLPFRFSGAK